MIHLFEKRMSQLFMGIMAIILIVGLSGCYTPNKARRDVTKANVHHPDVVAEICGNLYPPGVITKDSISYKQGETTYLPGDTITVGCDTVWIEGKPQIRYVKAACPPCPARVDTFYHRSETKVENTAKVTALQFQKDELQSKHDKLQGKVNVFLWWAIGATALLAVGVFLKLSKII